MHRIQNTLIAILMGLTLATPSRAASARNQTLCSELRVMTFNIRYGTAPDGENHWFKRQNLVFAVVREHKPDVLGLQEALRFQIDQILSAVPEYAAIGVGRDDGKTQGEHAAILYRTDRLKVSEQGDFWFSDTPDVPGSKHWGNRITRMCTWARFESKDGAAPFYVFNVHLDHESQPSREKSAGFLLEQIRNHGRQDAAIVTGDFNAGETNPAIVRMKGAFVDSFRLLDPVSPDVATFNGFGTPPPGGDKIDYIFVSPSIQVRQAAIVRDQKDGHYPSDHFPVNATLCLPRHDAKRE